MVVKVVSVPIAASTEGGGRGEVRVEGEQGVAGPVGRRGEFEPGETIVGKGGRGGAAVAIAPHHPHTIHEAGS